VACTKTGAPSLTAIFTRPWGGRLADRHGLLPVLLAGAAIMTVGALPALIPGSVPALLASRLLVGAGEGLMMSAAVLWLLRLAGPERRAKAMGHLPLANYVGLVAGPLLAQLLASTEVVLLLAAALPPLGAVAALLARPRADASAHGTDEGRSVGVVRATLRPGIGLLLVNFGYTAVVAFGAQVAHSSATLPLFAVCVIVVRVFGSGIPQRFGGRRVAVSCAAIEAAGLACVTIGGSSALVATAVFAAGQALAVPALGLLALADVPASRHGAAAGTFFAYFDAGVGLGGPTVGALVALSGPSGGMLGAALAVACVIGVIGPRGAAAARRARSRAATATPGS
jgi:predicted MFS family arabinose efflux permease